jgi:predicted AlkP superfamily phosphohydrolase/phosphomutase
VQQPKPSLAVIGLDGATFDVISPLVEQGELPFLGRIMTEGSHGPLESIIPPVTGPAWSVLATGKNPGQLGIFDFINRRRPDDFRLYPIRSADLAGQTFWDILDAAGYRVGILNYPMLVPAYPIDGWMVAGLGASRLHEYTYPAGLKQELDQITGGYEISVSYGLPKYRDNLLLLVRDLKRTLDSRLLAVEHLLSTRPVDVLVAVFSVSDVACHTMWKFWDYGASTVLDPDHERIREDFVSIWRSLDQAVGRILDRLSPDGHVLVVSDHGFGPSHGVFHVNQWLQLSGYLVRKGMCPARGNALREGLVERTSPYLGPIFRRVLGSKIHQALRASVLREIDLVNSKAFALEHTDSCGSIFVNHQYARARGLNEEDFERNVCAQLKRDLLAWGQREGLPGQTFSANELYWGDKAALSPELLFVVDGFRCSVSHRFAEPVYADRLHHPMKSGTHRMNGVVMAVGPDVLNVPIVGAQLQDIAPTVLHLLDLPVPVSMDGKILTGMLKSNLKAPRASEQPADERALADDIDVELLPADEGLEIVLQRLADLGYLD